MAASSPVRVASLAAALVFALLLAAAEPARASCRQIGNADYCVGEAQVTSSTASHPPALPSRLPSAQEVDALVPLCAAPCAR